MVESKTKLVFINRLCVELVQNLSELSNTIKLIIQKIMRKLRHTLLLITKFSSHEGGDTVNCHVEEIYQIQVIDRVQCIMWRMLLNQNIPCH